MSVDSSRCLLSSPLSSTVRAEVTLHRSTASYANTSDKFKIGTKHYDKQYYETYFKRLDSLRQLIVEQAHQSLGTSLTTIKLSDLREEDDDPRTEDILIVGTVFKQQENKPSVLKELSEDKDLDKPEEARTSYTGAEDHLVLEDETMRVKLCGEVDPSLLVNGVIMGCWGREASGGKFNVKQTFFPRIPTVKHDVVEDVSVCLVSGLQLDGEEAGSSLASLQLAADWICGGAGGLGDQEEAAQVERLIIAGDSLAESTRDRADMGKARYLTQNKQAGSVAAVRQLDELLVQLAGSLNTDLVPGETDPATGLLPQQPLHKCMFPEASTYPTFQTVTNPYRCELGGRELLVVSGQTLRDIARNCAITDSLEILERCLVWGHLAPTSPDTIGCYPYFEGQDPFILDTLPDVFIAGNQDSFAEKRIQLGPGGKEVLLVAVPRFATSRLVVRLGLKGLSCHVMEFAADVDEPASPEPNK